MKFNIYSKVTNPKENKLISFDDVFDIIKSDKLKEHTDYLRKEPDKDKRTAYKKKHLSAVTFQGQFSYRAKDKLVKSSGLAIIDIDDYEGDIQPIKEKIIADPFVYCAFVSPSGGLKVVMRIPEVKNDEEYKEIYENLLKHYAKFSPAGDISNKDISRLCFLSYDPDIYVNKEAKVFDKVETIVEHWNKKSKETRNKDTSRSGQEMTKIIKLLSEGYTKEEIFEYMKESEKWKSSPKAYRDLTYKNAKLHIKKEKEKKEKEKKNIRYKSSYVFKKEKCLIEQCYLDKKNIFYFYETETGKIRTVKDFKVGDLIYKPCLGEEIEKNVVFLPEKPVNYESEDILDKEILDFIHTYLDIPEDTKQFALWNIKRSWVFDRFHTLSYLRALGDAGLGKSRFLDTLGILHYKPIFIGGATTSAPIFRMIEKWRPTLVIDEADFNKSDESQDIIKIINLGYEKGKSLLRCEKNNNNKINCFDPFCPKVLSTRKPFEDKAVESRCITTTMTGTTRKDIPRNLDDDFFEKALQIRNKLLMWRFKNYFKIDTTKKIELEDIEPRVEQIVSNFGILFANDSNKLEFFKRFVKKQQENLIEERQNSVQGQIVEIIHQLCYNGFWNISNKDIVEKEEIFDERNKKVTNRGLNKYLKELGFKKSELIRINNQVKRCIPLEEKHIIKLFKRYGYPEIALNSCNVCNDCNDSNGQREEKNGSIKNEVFTNNKKNFVQTVTTVTNVTPLQNKIYHKCSICDGKIATEFDEKTGKPICELCKK